MISSCSRPSIVKCAKAKCTFYAQFQKFTHNSLFQPDGVQLDLRGLRKIELMETSRSSSGWAVKLGSGLSWNQVGLNMENILLYYNVLKVLDKRVIIY